MIGAPEFPTLEHMQNSAWLVKIRDTMSQDQWPEECDRCRQTELTTNESIRTYMIKFDQQQTKSDYLMVGGVLDNICNSACQTCNASLSTKIGSLSSRNYIKINNTDRFWQLPQDRITHLDLNGGEPSYSPNYKRILANPPPNLQSLRLNTNGSTVLEELVPMIERGIDVTVTVSFDGVGAVHDYVRWPIRWEKFYQNLMRYKTLPVKLNLWTTVSALNIANMPEIFDFANQHNIDHAWALLHTPSALSVEYANALTVPAKELDHPGMTVLQPFIAAKENNQSMLDAYIAQQDQLRGISYKDYFK